MQGAVALSNSLETFEVHFLLSISSLNTLYVVCHLSGPTNKADVGTLMLVHGGY